MQRIVRFLVGILIAVILAIVLTYAVDALRAWYMMSKQDPQLLETTQIRRLYAIPQKDGKFSYSFGDLENQTCIHSLFPQLSYEPCWYAHQQSKKPVYF